MAIPVQIIEDNRAAVTSLTSYLSECPSLEILPLADNLAAGEAAILEHHPSLIFLDVELPDGNGVEFWENIRSRITWNTYVVFYTAFDRYAIDALRAKAHDYVLKPILKTDVQGVLQRFFMHCAEHFANKNTDETTDNELDTLSLLVVDQKNNRVVIKPSDIGYFSYLPERKVWEVFCSDKNSYILRHGINSTRLVQISPDFEQVHKSYIVNVRYMSKVENNRIVLLPPFDDVTCIQVSKLYKNALFEHFNQL